MRYSYTRDKTDFINSPDQIPRWFKLCDVDLTSMRNRVVALSASDNLCLAAGSAIQNMNVMFDMMKWRAETYSAYTV